jgi:hypothetical protein
MRTRPIRWLAVAIAVLPCSLARAQACLATATPTFLTGPRGDSLEVVGPSLLPLADGLMMFGSGSDVFRAGRAPTVERALLGVRLRRGAVELIEPPAPGGRYLYPRAVQDAGGGIHLLWGEPDSSRTLPAAASDEPGSGFSQALWRADYRDGAWSPARRLAALSGMMWFEVTPSRPTGRSPVMTAVAHPGRGGGFVDIHFADASGWTVRSLPVGGLAVYTSIAPVQGGFMLGFIGGDSGGQSRPRNTVFITDSLSGDSAWARPIALGRAADQAATMLSLLPGRAGTVHAVWGQNFTGGLDAQAVRHLVLDARGRVLSPPQDLRVDDGLQELHAEPDARGGLHVVFQAAGKKNQPRATYAYWSPRTGWSDPVALTPGAYSRDPAIAATTGDSLYITYAAHLGMREPVPRFATAVLKVGTGGRCAP